MCEVSARGSVAGEAATQEDDALEKIFSECDVSSTGKVSVSTLIGYMRDHMSTQGSPEILKDLRESMRAASFEGEVSRKEYYDVSRRWLAKIRKSQQYQDNYQDSNNNLHNDYTSADNSIDVTAGLPANGQPESTTRGVTTLRVFGSAEDRRLNTAGSESGLETRTLHGIGFLDLSTSTVVDAAISCDGQDPFFGDISSVDDNCEMGIDDPVFRTAQDLRLRAHRCAIDNDHLKEELQRTEDSIATLERQLAAIERKLELANNRCERLQKENDEHKELLVVSERDRETLGARNKCLERDNYVLRREIRTTEAEIRRLSADLDRTEEQKEEQIRLLTHCRQELMERQALLDEARGENMEMGLVNDQLRDKHDISTSTIKHLKIVVKELEAQISELQANQNRIRRDEGLFASPSSVNEFGSDVEICPDFANTLPRSLLDEMQATEYAEVGVNRSDEIEIFNGTIVDRNMKDDYTSVIRCATQQLEGVTADLAESYEKLGIAPLSESNFADANEQLLQVSEEGECCSSDENLRRFNQQLRLVLNALSLTALRRIDTADMKDATTQLGQLELVSEQTAVCDIDTGRMRCANNNKGDRSSCPGCRRGSGTRHNTEQSLTVEAANPEVGLAVSTTASLVPSLDISSTSCGVIGTPSSSPELNSPYLHQGYYCERSTIIPIVTAVDETIQESSGTSHSDQEISCSSVDLRRDHNRRYIYTLPSGQPSELEYKISSDAESQLSLRMPKDAVHVRESSGWRWNGSSIMDDTSDDTGGTGSNKSHSPSLVELNFRSSVVDLSDSATSTQSNEYGGFNGTKQDRTKEYETCKVGLALTSATNQILSEPYHGPDVVEDLNSDLKRLTLRSGTVSGKKCSVWHSNSHPQRKKISARDYGKTPKRKKSVYHRTFDCFNDKLGVNLKKNGRKIPSLANVENSESVNESFLMASSQWPDDPHAKQPNLTPETSRSHAVATTESFKDAIEFSERVINNTTHMEELTHPPTTSDTKILEYRYEYFDRPSTQLPNVQVAPTVRSMVEPIKSEMSPENHQTKHVSSCPRNVRQPTPRLPTNEEATGDVASARSRSVVRAMSSEEDSSDSECVRDRIDGDERVQVVVAPLPPPTPSPPLSTPQRLMQMQLQTQVYPLPISTPLPLPQQQQASLQLSTIGIISDYSFVDPLSYSDDTSERITGESNENFHCQFKHHKRLRRSFSESDREPCHGSVECNSRCVSAWTETGNRIVGVHTNALNVTEDIKTRKSIGVFPNLPDARLIELGLAGPTNGFDVCERVDEDELERKYTALSIGLGTDRITLPRRLALSLRQRDHAERNLTTEVERMQRDIQALAPLCVDRESVERVERVRHQLEIITRCTLRVSCTAELLGATHQERRVSMAALLADRYLQALRARCEKLSAELAETKRILAENNIVVEENPSELIDDVVSRVRYRGVSSANRTTMSKRRASIATISRPTTVNSLQEATKDNGRQHRTSVPARMTLRRPSLSYDMQRWDNDKLDRTDSSSSIGELREIFEQAESRRGSREENNNLVHSQLSNFSTGSCESGDSEIWANTRDDSVGSQIQAGGDQPLIENRFINRRTPRAFRTIQERVSRLPLSWYILFVAIFFFGFYSNRFVTSRSAVPLKWWSVDEIVKRYTRVQCNVPPPI